MKKINQNKLKACLLLNFIGLALPNVNTVLNSIYSSPTNPGYPTQIIIYQPASSTQNLPSKSGVCFASSVAATRPDVWRCSDTDNVIHDPCFRVSTNDDKVICDVNPLIATSGLVLQLSQPLPTESESRISPLLPTNNGWLLKLSDNTFCTPFTGTLPVINGMVLKYSCSDSSGCDANNFCSYMTGIYDNIRIGKVWTAQKVFYSVIPNVGIKIIKTIAVNVTTVWQ